MTGERRSPFGRPHDGPAEIPCRVCFRYVHLEPSRMFRAGAYDDAYWALACPECGGSFLVRGGDVPHAAGPRAS